MSTEDPSSTSTGSAQRRGVLVVDDDPDIREALRQAIEGDGYSVVTAVDGADAIASLGLRAHPCLILLDLMMPGMNGLDFLDAMQKDEDLATIPVVVVSAYEDLARSARGSSGYLKKPMDLDALLSTVRRFCRT